MLGVILTNEYAVMLIGEATLGTDARKRTIIVILGTFISLIWFAVLITPFFNRTVRFYPNPSDYSRLVRITLEDIQGAQNEIHIVFDAAYFFGRNQESFAIETRDIFSQAAERGVEIILILHNLEETHEKEGGSDSQRRRVDKFIQSLPKESMEIGLLDEALATSFYIVDSSKALIIEPNPIDPQRTRILIHVTQETDILEAVSAKFTEVKRRSAVGK